MTAVLLDPPFEAAALAEASTDTLKSSLLQCIDGRDGDPMGKKVRFGNQTLRDLPRNRIPVNLVESAREKWIGH